MFKTSSPIKALFATLLATSLAFVGTAEASFKTKQQIAAKVTAATKADRSTVVKYNRGKALVRSEGSDGIRTRTVNTSSLRILKTGKNVLPKARMLAALDQASRGAFDGHADYGYKVVTPASPMTRNGNIALTITNAGEQGKTEGRTVLVTPAGTPKKVIASPNVR